MLIGWQPSLILCIKMRSWHKNNVKIEILVVKLLLKEVSHKFLCSLVQNLPFPRDFGSHQMVTILTFGVKMRSWHKNNVRIEILVVKLLLKEVSHKFLGGLVQKLCFVPDFGSHRMAAILTFGVKMRSWHKNNVRIGILVVKLLLKEVSHKFLAGLVQKLDFARFRWRPFWKIVNIWKCSRDVAWHPPESWRAIRRLQEIVEKKTLTSETTLTPNQGFGPWTNMLSHCWGNFGRFS